MSQETILLSDSQRIKKEFLIPLHRQEEKLKKRCYNEDGRERSVRGIYAYLVLLIILKAARANAAFCCAKIYLGQINS